MMLHILHNITKYPALSPLSPSLLGFSQIQKSNFSRYCQVLPRPRLTLLSSRPCLIKLPPPPAPYMFPQPGSASLCPHIAANIYIKLICIHSHIVRAIYNGSPPVSWEHQALQIASLQSQREKISSQKFHPSNFCVNVNFTQSKIVESYILTKTLKHLMSVFLTGTYY